MTTRGELRRALHWAQQAADLDTPDHEVVAHRETTRTARKDSDPLTSLMLLRLWHTLRGHESDKSGGLTIGTFHACAGTLSRALTVAVQGLQVEPAGSAFGFLSWPDDTLADQMQQCFIC